MRGGTSCMVAALAGMALAPHARAAVLTMGVGQQFPTLAAAVAAASAGDTIEIAPGTYTDQDADITVPLILVGAGSPGSVVFTADAQLPNDKGFLLIDATTTVSNLTFENATADSSSNNGAGIRYQTGNLTVLNSQFIDDQDGILATPGVAGTGAIVVENSTFLGDGVATGPGAGYAHGIYATDVASLTVIDSSFNGTQQGHDIKSRAIDTIIVGNSLDDGVTGTTSYAIDLPNGGDAEVIGNTITQGDNSPNWTMLAYGEEGLTHADNSVLIDGNVFDNTLPTAYGVNNASTVDLAVTCNAFDGVSNPIVGPAISTGNVIDGPLPDCAISAAAALPTPTGPATLLPGLLLLLGIRRRRA